MKKQMIFGLAASLLLLAACKKEEASDTDKKAPVITAAEGRTAIRPENKEVRGTTTDYMHVRFQVTDPSGISEALVDIHHAFDGHAHGKTTSTFEHLSVRKIYKGNGAVKFNIDSSFDDIYWGGPGSLVTGNVLAGPYDFMIEAVDIHGNQTSAAAGTNYIATVYIERPYAPAVAVTNLVDGELEGLKNTPLDVQGAITKTANALSSDLVFVKIRLGEEDDHNHKTASGDIYEAAWGTPKWTNTVGIALPNTTAIQFSDLLIGAKELVLPNEEGHFELEIWVEDAEGNVTRKLYEVHVN